MASHNNSDIDAALAPHPQMFELAVATDESEEVRVEGMPPETYLERFAWDEAKYPPRRPLGETVGAITDIVQQLEDGLKVHAQWSSKLGTSGLHYLRMG